jgi:signal transduction histidine kinase
MIDQTGHQVVRPDADSSPAGRSDAPIRLSMRAKLVLSVLVASLPLAAVAAYLAWNIPARWWVLVGALLIVCAGCAVTSWAYQPIDRLGDRARRLASLPPDQRRLFGLLRTDARGVEMVSDSLDRIEHSLQEIQGLNRVGQMVASDATLPEILKVIVEEAVALLRADAGIIGLWDEERQLFRDQIACNLPIFFPDRDFGARDSLASHVAATRRPIFVNDYLHYPLRIKELDRLQLRAALGVPLMVGDECHGSLVVHTVDTRRQFTHRDGQLLLTFANQAAAAFEKARLHKLALDQLEALTRARAALAQESAELERALSPMVRLQEEERARIAADVHDGVVQTMVGSLCELQAAMAHLAVDPQRVVTKLGRARDLVRDSITELRRVIYDLRPIALDTAGLVPAIENLRDELEQRAGITIRLSVIGSPGRFSPETEIGVYRIVQEALNNAVKHAAAHLVQVSIRFGDGELTVRVSDDGTGFALQEAATPDGDHAGLIGMQERARSLGGKLALSSRPGEGTTITAVIPCSPALRERPIPPLDQIPAHDQDENTVSLGGEGHPC